MNFDIYVSIIIFYISYHMSHTVTVSILQYTVINKKKIKKKWAVILEPIYLR